MGRKKDISPTKVARMVTLREEGYSYRVIAERLNVSKTAVGQCIKRHKASGSYNAKKRTGRRKCTSSTTDRVIHRHAVSDPACSSSFIHSQLPTTSRPSTRTIRRRLVVDYGLRSYHPACVPALSRKNMNDRLKFAKKYSTWTNAEWSKVLFSDESIIKQFYAFCSHVRRPKGARLNSRYTIPRVKMSPSTMVWGTISSSGRGSLWFMPPNSTITAAVYLDLLKEKLQDALRRWNCTYFQQDGAPAHTARSVRSWLNNEGIQLLTPWPGNSPDLNPIENCWAVVKKKVSQHNPTSLTDLQEKIKLVWCTEITREYCAALIESMPRRLAAVIAAKGGSTKY